MNIVDNESLEGSFMEVFERSFAPRLGIRVEGFRQIFSNLQTHNPRIVETGCLRLLNNWSGDGQSTFMFDLFAQKYDGEVYSIDSSFESVSIAQSVISGRTVVIQGNGAEVIHNGLYLGGAKIDLLYLDSFDAFRDVSEVPGPIHYLTEFCAAWPQLTKGSIIAIDDYASPGTNGNGINKGLGVDRFLSLVKAEVLFDGYQKIWRLT